MMIDHTDAASIVEFENGFILSQGDFVLKVFKDGEFHGEFLVKNELKMKHSSDSMSQVVEHIFQKIHDLSGI